MEGGIRHRRLAAALFLVTLATVMFQVLLTRIFSVTMWYHFAFMAISMAMFGMTIGALAVFLRPAAWPAAQLEPRMAAMALCFGITMAAFVMLHVYFYLPNPAIYLAPMLWTFGAAAVPFFFSGVFVSLALTRFPAQIARLYAVDLAGAGMGCLAVIVALHWLDGVGAVLACGALAATAAALLSRDTLRLASLGATALLAGLALASGVHLASRNLALFPLQYIKGTEQAPIDYERWNSFSRIAVLSEDYKTPAAWSLSPAYQGPPPAPSRWLQMDAAAGTQLVRFDGELPKLEFLRWDLTNFVHHVRSGAAIGIVGAGGGRDVLAAKLFGQKRVVAVEINPNIMAVLNRRFGAYTGHLDRDPAVSFVNDEARSYLTRADERFDVIELTFIDTWAATAAGAFVLTENSLYTVEAWKMFLDRLRDDGLLSVTRALGPEMGRLVALGREALRANGIAAPERHMVVVTNPRPLFPLSWGPMGLLLVRKTPFDAAELARIRAAAERMRFEIELAPGATERSLLGALALGEIPDEVARGATNYDAPTDDRPFFFNMLRPSHWLAMRAGHESLYQQSVVVLMDLLAAVTVLVILCVFLPLRLSRLRLPAGGRALVAYFAAIGLGFMLVEISMMQRLIVFLGHPIYSLSVILFSLLVSGGIGAGLSSRVTTERVPVWGPRLLSLTIGVLLLAGLATVPLVTGLAGARTPVRIGASVVLLGAIGTFMGMAFPLGMRVAQERRPGLGPWLWGVNGAMSVLASVLAVVIAMAFGISVGFACGVACYAAALLAFRAATKA